MADKNVFRLIGKYRTEIMGIAALLIYMFHEWKLVLCGVPIFAFVECYLVQFGFAGVDVFFFLSGMGLVRSIETHSLPNFYQRRLERVLLPYAIIAICFKFYYNWETVYFLKNLLGIHFFTRSIYSLLWFVPAITVLYLLFPLYYRFFRRSEHKIQFTTAVLLMWLLLTMLLRNRIRNDLFGFTNRIPVFIIGVLVGWTAWKKEVSFTGCSWAVVLLTFCLGMLFAYRIAYEKMELLVPIPNCCFPNLLMAVSGCCLVAGFFSLLDRFAGGIGKGVRTCLAFFGKISLEFYCVQEWVGSFLQENYLKDLGSLTVNLITLICVIAAALVLHQICEVLKYILVGFRKRIPA